MIISSDLSVIHGQLCIFENNLTEFYKTLAKSEKMLYYI